MEENTAKFKGKGRFAAIGSAFLSASKYEPQRPHIKIILQSESIIQDYLQPLVLRTEGYTAPWDKKYMKLFCSPLGLLYLCYIFTSIPY